MNQCCVTSVLTGRIEATMGATTLEQCLDPVGDQQP